MRRTKTNKEMEDLLERKDIFRFLKMKKFAWLGHVERMKDDRLIEKLSWVDTCTKSACICVALTIFSEYDAHSCISLQNRWIKLSNCLKVSNYLNIEARQYANNTKFYFSCLCFFLLVIYSPDQLLKFVQDGRPAWSCT